MAIPYLNAPARPVIGAADITALRAVSSSQFTPLGMAFIELVSNVNVPKLYYWDPTSNVSDDGVTVLQPDDGMGVAPGRWIDTGFTTTGGGGGGSAFFGDAVSDLTALRALTGYSDGETRLVKNTLGGDEQYLYSFNASFGGTVADNGTTVVKPNDILTANPGRWEPSVGPRQNLVILSLEATAIDGHSGALAVGGTSDTTSLAIGRSGIVPTIANAVAIGTSPAQSGTVRIPNATTLSGRGAGSYDIPLIGVDNTDQITSGDSTNTTNVIASVKSGGLFKFLANGTEVLDIGATNGISFEGSQTPFLTQAQRSGTGSNAGSTFTVKSQKGQNVSSGTNNSGGTVVIQSGAPGTGGSGGSNGEVQVKVGSTSAITVASDASVTTLFSNVIKQGSGPYPTTGTLRVGEAFSIVGVDGTGTNNYFLLHVNGADVIHFGDDSYSNGLFFHTKSSTLITFDFNGNDIYWFDQSGTQHFGKTTSAALFHEPQTTDVTTHNFNITTQAPFASAGEGHNNSGSFIVNIPDAVGDGDQGSIKFDFASLGQIVMTADGASFPNNMLMTTPGAWEMVTPSPLDGTLQADRIVIKDEGGTNQFFLKDGTFTFAGGGVPTIACTDNTSNGATGDDLTIHGLNCTGTTSFGGDIKITPGTGTSKNGNIYLCGDAGVGGGAGVISIPNSPTAPSTAASSGIILYVSGGRLFYMDGAGVARGPL